MIGQLFQILDLYTLIFVKPLILCHIKNCCLNQKKITGKCFSWVKDFLTGRSQKVKVGDSFSDEHNVTSGVPQGSVLGPTLFLIFINDLLDIKIKSKVFLFADDVKLYNLSCNQNDLQTDLDLIYDWSEKCSSKFIHTQHKKNTT